MSAYLSVCVCVSTVYHCTCVCLHFNVPQGLRWGQGEVQEVLSIKGSLACAWGMRMTCSGECVIKGAAYSASHITLHSAPHLTITRQTSVQIPVHLSLFSTLLSCTDPGRWHHRHCSGPYRAWPGLAWQPVSSEHDESEHSAVDGKLRMILSMWLSN